MRRVDPDNPSSIRSLARLAGNLNNKPATRNNHTAQPGAEPTLNRFASKPLALGPAAHRGIPHPDRRGMAGIPRALRTPQGRHRYLRAGIRHPLHPRTRLHPLPRPLARPSPAAPARRDPRQPDRPHRRSRTRRLDRRSRRPQDQPRRRPGQARPNRPARQDRQHRRPGHASLPPGHQPLKVSQPLTRQLKTKIIFLSSENAE